MKEDAQRTPAKKQQLQDPALKVTDFQPVFSLLCPWLELYFFGGWRACPLAGSQFSNQKLNHGHGSESPESQPLGHQETPGTFILNKTKISAMCKISKRSNQSETLRCKRIPQEPESWPCKPGTQLPLKPSLLLQLQKNSPGSQKSTTHYYFSWSIIALQRCVSLCSIAE